MRIAGVQTLADGLLPWPGMPGHGLINDHHQRRVGAIVDGEGAAFEQAGCPSRGSNHPRCSRTWRTAASNWLRAPPRWCRQSRPHIPVPGRKLVMPAATTPGLLDKRSINPWLNWSAEIWVGYCRAGGDSRRPAHGRDGSRDRPQAFYGSCAASAPDTVSSMSAIAISEMTRVERSHAWLKAALPVGAPWLEAFRQIGPQGGEGRRKAAQGPGGKGQEQGKDDDACIHGDGVDARHGIRQ